MSKSRYEGREGLRLRREPPRATRQGLASLKQYPSRKFLQRFRCRNVFDLHPVFAFVGVARFEESGIPRWFIAQEQQSFGVRVEAADRIHILRKPKLGERTIRRAVCRELRKHA